MLSVKKADLVVKMERETAFDCSLGSVVRYTLWLKRRRQIVYRVIAGNSGEIANG